MKTISRIFIASLFLLVTYVSNAQGINFQGVARSANGTILASSNISLRLSILSKSVDATAEYVETKKVVTNAQGIFSIVIGDGVTATVGTFTSINWANAPKFLKVEMDPSGGTSYISMGITQLQYVPYAFYSLGVAADNVTGVLAVEKGGTGVGSLADLKTALKITSFDTTSLSNRVDSKLTKGDTVSLSNRINAKMESSNTTFASDITVNGLTVGLSGGQFGNSTALGKAALNSNTTGGGNTAIGSSALSLNTTSSGNTAVGNNALAKSTGSSNTSIGSDNMPVNTTGSYNTSVGAYSFYNNTTGSNNIGMGRGHLYNNTTGSSNIAIGNDALQYNVSADNNIAIGSSALNKNTTGSPNIGIGSSALFANTTGYNNIGIGISSLSANTTGAENIAIGRTALTTNTTGGQNISLGTNSLTRNTTGSVNTAIGLQALSFNTTGSYNVGISTSALQANTTGSFNIAIGKDAMLNNTSGSNNLALGYQTLNLNTTASNNTAVGFNSLLVNTTGNANSTIGAYSLKSNTTGYNNTAIGFNSLYSNTTGYNNTALGLDALHFSTTGNNNIAGGTASLYNNTTGFDNTGYGIFSLYLNTTGAQNTSFGIRSGATNTTGSNNTFLGYQADVASGTISNATAIGNGAIVSASNTIQLGNANVTSVKTAGVLSSSAGFMPPKFSAVQRDAIVNPEQGLTIYCYNCGTYGELEVYNGVTWVNASGSSAAAALTDVTNGLVASFPLDGTPYGTITNTAVQVSTITKAMTSAWTYTLPATDPNKVYKMVVTGTWGIANGNAHRDAAYDAGSNNTIGSSGTPVANRGCDANWSFEGVCPPPVPTSPAGYASNHSYEYLIGPGKTGGYALAFSDGAYGDNVGSLTFTLYETGIAGSTTGSVTYTTNRKGTANSAMQGGAGYITAPSNIFQFTRTQEFSVSIWFTADAVTTSGRLLSTENSEGNFRIAKYDLNNIAVQYGDYITQTVTNNDWHHLVYTYNNHLEKIYIDGVLVQTNTDASTEALNYGAPFTIGAKAASAFDKWAGKIDDVKVYNRAILPNEVLVLYNQ